MNLYEKFREWLSTRNYSNIPKLSFLFAGVVLTTVGRGCCCCGCIFINICLIAFVVVFSNWSLPFELLAVELALLELAALLLPAVNTDVRFDEQLDDVFELLHRSDNARADDSKIHKLVYKIKLNRSILKRVWPLPLFIPRAAFANSTSFRPFICFRG